ncbi:MAG: ATP-binding protein [Alphaproteobacteria bacterium]
MRPSVPISRVLISAAIVTLPVNGVLCALWLGGGLHPAIAVGAMAASVAVTALLLRSPIADMMAVAAYARSLTQGDDAGSPELSSWWVAGELSGAIVQLRRSWVRKTSTLESLAVSSDIILDSLPDPLLLLDRGRRVTRANLAARQLFQRDPKDQDVATVLRDPALLEAVDAALGDRRGALVPLVLFRPVRRDIEARIEPLPPGTTGHEAAVLVLGDVTARKRMEQMRVDFIANVSHELRTPLSALVGFIETLQGTARDDPEARERFLPIMHDQTLRMARLVSDLLSLSRIELDEHTQPEGRVDLARIAADVAAAFEIKAREKGVRLVVTADADLPPAAGDADQLTQVMTNLVDNAIKYTRTDTAVEIAASTAPQGPPSMPRAGGDRVLVVTVRDHGAGMAREHLPRLTERFYRVDAARSRELGGTGLGLAIVKHVVNRHRGALVIDSEVDRGSTFSVYLPMAPAHHTS